MIREKWTYVAAGVLISFFAIWQLWAQTSALTRRVNEQSRRIEQLELAPTLPVEFEAQK